MTRQVGDANRWWQRHQLDRKRVRRTRWLIAAMIAAVLAGLTYLVGFSPLLVTQKIVVTGLKVLTKQEVTAAAGVVLQTPLARVDAAAVADRVAGLAAVARVAVVRAWPDTLEIAVTERRARLAIRSGSGYQLADANGVVFREVTELPSGLVFVVAPANDQQLLMDIGTVFSSLSPDTAATVDRVEATSADGIELRLRDGARVIWGSAEQSNLKSQVLDGLLLQSGSRFDVSAPGFPARR